MRLWQQVLHRLTGRKPPKLKGTGSGNANLALFPWRID